MNILHRSRPQPLSLPTTSTMLESWVDAHKHRAVVMQHALRDTASFLGLLRKVGLSVDGFIAKPNSTNATTISALSNDGFHVIEEQGNGKPYDYFATSTVIPQMLAHSAMLAGKSNGKTVFVDVGGHLLGHLQALPESLTQFVAGVVEVTTLGHNAYVASQSKLPVPVISIARSPLKDAEAVSVGDSAIRATEDLLQGVGRLLPGLRAGVIGYGMIGKRTARAAQRRGLRVVIFDTNGIAALRASLDGFPVVSSLDEFLSEVDLVYSSTGSTAVKSQHAVSAKQGQFWLSVGSRAWEFDVGGLRNLAVATNAISPHLEEFTLANGKTIVVANNGKAVNFLKDGTPEEAMDIVFAEQAVCLQRLLDGSYAAIGEVMELSAVEREKIARKWLKHRHNDADYSNPHAA